MPTNITDTDTFTDPIQAPVDGESATGASVQLPAQGLANRARNLLNRILGNGVDANVAPLQLTALATDHVAEPTNFWKVWRQANTGSAGGIKVREFVGTGGSFTGAFYCKTVNARWNATAKLWQSDDTTAKSLMYASVGNSVVMLHKAATAGTWTDAQWDAVPIAATDGRLLLSGEVGYAAARIARRKLNLASAMIVSGWSLATDLGGVRVLVSTADSAIAEWPIEIPTGSIIRGVFAIVKPGDTTGVVTLSLRRSSGGSISPLTPPSAATSVGSAASDGTANLQLLDASSLSETVNQSPLGGNEYVLRVAGSNNGGTVDDFIYLVAVDFDDVGLRNT